MIWTAATRVVVVVLIYELYYNNRKDGVAQTTITQIEDLDRAFADADWTRGISAFSQDVAWTNPDALD